MTKLTEASQLALASPPGEAEDGFRPEEEEEEKNKTFQTSPTDLETQWKQLKAAEELCQRQKNYILQCKHRQKEKPKGEHMTSLCKIHQQKPSKTVQHDTDINLISDVLNIISPSPERHTQKKLD